MDWKNKIKNIKFRKGFDRLYFVATLVWYIVFYIVFFIGILDSEVNFYTDNLIENILGQIFILAVPFVIYIVSISVFKIFLWIINGFRANSAKVKVKIFTEEGNFFKLIRKYWILVLGIVIILILISIFISFNFTIYNSYEMKWELQRSLYGRKSLEEIFKQ